MTLGIAVLSDDNMFICRGERKVQRVGSFESFVIGNVEGLCELSLKHDIGTLWVCPGSELSEEIAAHPDGFTKHSTDFDVRVNVDKNGLPLSVSIKKIHGVGAKDRMVFIGIPDGDMRWARDDGSWALEQVENPLDLLGAMCYLREALDIDVKYSPGWSGVRYMKKRNVSRPDWVQKISLPDVGEFREGDCLWTRALTEDEARKKYMHFYDGNSKYLAAATGAELGEGTPEYTTTYDSKACGEWDITLLPPHDYSDLLPFIVENAKSWAVTPVVEMAKKMGYRVQVHGGYVWKKHHRILQAWAKNLWDLRLSLKTDTVKYPNSVARIAAYEMVKLIANQSIGWLDLTKERGKPEAKKDQWHRPDWHDQIIGLARARMFLKIWEIVQLVQMYPCAVYTDAIAYCSDDPNPETAVPGLMRRSTELGGFKHVRTLPMSGEIVALFGSDLPAYEVMGRVKKLVGEQF
jgi:hypothetical protein